MVCPGEGAAEQPAPPRPGIWSQSGTRSCAPLGRKRSWTPPRSNLHHDTKVLGSRWAAEGAAERPQAAPDTKNITRAMSTNSCPPQPLPTRHLPATAMPCKTCTINLRHHTRAAPDSPHLGLQSLRHRQQPNTQDLHHTRARTGMSVQTQTCSLQHTRTYTHTMICYLHGLPW